MTGVEIRTITIDGRALTVTYGVREGADGAEHIVSVPGLDDAIVGESEEQVMERAERAIHEHINHVAAVQAREQQATVDGRPAAIRYDEKEHSAEEQELINVPLEELARTLARLDREDAPLKAEQARIERERSKITTRRKKVIAELEKRGEKLLDRQLGLGEYDQR